MPGLLLALFAVIVAWGCGRREDSDSRAGAPTPFGKVGEVSAYLQAVNPHIQTIVRLQQQYEEGLAASPSGSSERRGTGRNLAARAEVVLPALRHVQEELDGLQAPPLLAPFHRDLRKLIALRLEAYTKTLEGWGAEQKGDRYDPLYREAEGLLDEANRLIQQLNDRMLEINTALEAASAATPPSS